jgi:CheY-like chemotaxis protein
MIVDPALPGEQPSAVLDRLLNLCAGGETRLLLCTGSLREARAAAAPLEARGGAVLLKPFAVEELLACIARLTYRLAQPAGCGG